MKNRTIAVGLLLLARMGSAEEAQISVDECIIKSVGVAGPEVTAKEIRDNCQRLDTIEEVEVPKRVLVEKATEDNPYVITGHRQNYILPVSYMEDPNQSPYNNNFYPGEENPVKNEEVKLQLSIKVPLTYSEVLVPNDAVYFGFTLKSFWQFYASEVSSPFRETNYRPEVYYEAPIPSQFWGGTLLTRVGIEHESNGRGGDLSRSWNRVFAGVGFAKNDWGVYLQPWWRIPEDAKEMEDDADGDDNPDINKYMGYYELHGVYKHNDFEFSAMSRLNWATGYGAIEAGMSFPLYGRLRGFVQYFNGYGESLIDYDHHQQRIGVGFLLTGLL